MRIIEALKRQAHRIAGGSDDLRRMYGEPEYRAANPFLKPPALKKILRGHVLYWRNKAWAVEVAATQEEKAVALGVAIRKGLNSKRSLTAADPFLHDLPMYVLWSNGSTPPSL